MPGDSFVTRVGTPTIRQCGAAADLETVECVREMVVRNIGRRRLEHPLLPPPKRSISAPQLSRTRPTDAFPGSPCNELDQLAAVAAAVALL
jgi:hypothetical protein